jgi:hypothetical protein
MKRHPIQQFGACLGIIGGAALVTIFLTVLINGRWPEFLEPIRNLFGLISDWTGSFALIAEIWLFIGPGALIYYWGKSLTEKRQDG